MWTRIRRVTSAVKTTIVNLTLRTKESIQALPTTVREIKNNEKIRNAFGNLISLNVLEFLLPAFALNYGKQVLFGVVREQAGSLQPVVNVAETITDYTIMSILLLRWRAKLIALNAVTTMTSATEIDEAHIAQKNPTNDDAATIALNTIAAQLQFLLNNYVVWRCFNLVLGETYGSGATLLFNCYRDGTVAYSYPQKAWCTDELSHERTRCMALGVTTQLLSYLPVQALALAGISVSSDVKLVWNNFIYLLGIMHAYKVPLPKSTPQSLETYRLVDPLVITAGISHQIVNFSAGVIALLIRHEKAYPGFFSARLQALYNKLHSVTPNAAGQLALAILLPKELLSLKEFAEEPHVAPYSQIVIAKLESYLQYIKEITQLTAVRATRSIIRTSWVGAPAQKLGEWYLEKFREWPKEVIELLIIVCKVPHLTQRLEQALRFLRTINPEPFAVVPCRTQSPLLAHSTFAQPLAITYQPTAAEASNDDDQFVDAADNVDINILAEIDMDRFDVQKKSPAEAEAQAEAPTEVKDLLSGVNFAFFAQKRGLGQQPAPPENASAFQVALAKFQATQATSTVRQRAHR